MHAIISERRDVRSDESIAAGRLFSSGHIVEGASRESKKDYLHFLYIARGSLSETQYFIHLSQRLNYLSSEQSQALHGQTKVVFGCLHGLIRAVEKEAGKLGKIAATVTSLVAIGLMRWSSGQLSVVS